MKTNLSKYLAVGAALLAASMAVTSCSETDAEKDKDATPVIKYVRSCDPTKSDSMIVAAALGDKLAFVGEGLGAVQQVWFNDQKAKLNPTMVTSNVIIVDVPNVIPGEVTNIAKFITASGSTLEYPFQISVPGPRIDAMDCEYAKPGTTATLSGAYFVDDPNVPMTVTFAGDKNAEIVSYTQESVTFTVPEGAEEGPIMVETIYGSSKTSFNYADTRGMLFDFEDNGITGLGLPGCGQRWHENAYGDDERSISGRYYIFGDGSTVMSADGGWNDGKFAFEYWPGSWNTPTDYPARLGERLTDIVDFSDYNNMSLKFEMMIPSEYPWGAGAMQIIFGGVDKITLGNAGTDIYGNTVAGSNNDYFQGNLCRGLYRPWTESEPFHTTGKWITVSYPLNDCVYNQNGGKGTTPLTEADFSSLVLFITGGGITGTECTPLVLIDNIRAVKN